MSIVSSFLTIAFLPFHFSIIIFTLLYSSHLTLLFTFCVCKQSTVKNLSGVTKNVVCDSARIPMGMCSLLARGHVKSVLWCEVNALFILLNCDSAAQCRTEQRFMGGRESMSRNVMPI